jgi:hypothetical protein
MRDVGECTAVGGGRRHYYSFNMPSAITQGSSSNARFFQYDTEHARYWKAAPEGGTLYFDAFGVHAELFLGTNWAWYDYLSAGGAMIGVWVQNATSTTPLYFHPDNLGSIAVITDATGAVVTNGRQGYDAWGKRRWANGADGRMAGFRSTGSSAEKRSSSAAPRELSTVVSHPSRRPECEACPSSDPMFGAPAIEGSLAQRTQVHSILDTPGAWRPRFLLVIEIQSKSILTDVHHDAYMTSDIR